jgi:hypothetical protein
VVGSSKTRRPFWTRARKRFMTLNLRCSQEKATRDRSLGILIFWSLVE